VSPAAGPILLAYDGSDSSAAAIAAAGRLLRGGQALVCHCWTGLSRAMLRSDPSELPGALRQAAEELDAADREAAERIAAEGVRLALGAGFEAWPLPARKERKTWRTLLEQAERRGASAIVAGAHGLSGVGRALLGSVSTALVHHSALPVLVVPTTAAPDGPLLLRWDGSEPARHALAAECSTTAGGRYS
jgi:nucleotide-binding universal stress UspA family protein